jgi:phosphoglycerate dehydrogenase-like enzyme
MTTDASLRPLVASVPHDEFRDLLGTPDGVEVIEWDLRSPAPRPRIDLVVLPYGAVPLLHRLDGVETALVQSLSIGFDGAEGALPVGHRYANGSSVHEAATAELALTIVLAAQRDLPRYLESARLGGWDDGARAPGLADRRVLLLGYGGVAKAIEARLLPFEADVVRVATTARVEAGRRVHGIDELPALIGDADVVIASVPLRDDTVGLLSRDLLSRVRDGALVVNVGRGPVVDTAALLDEVRSGRIRAALDVIDPEPLPAGHPAFTLPGLLLTPHIGGFTEAGPVRIRRLLADQVARLRAGDPPRNVVLDTTADTDATADADAGAAA